MRTEATVRQNGAFSSSSSTARLASASAWPTSPVLNWCVPHLPGRIPLRRAASPDEIAAVIAFLASDGAGYMTGSSVPVDGGWLASG